MKQREWGCRGNLSLCQDKPAKQLPGGQEEQEEKEEEEEEEEQKVKVVEENYWWLGNLGQDKTPRIEQNQRVKMSVCQTLQINHKKCQEIQKI